MSFKVLIILKKVNILNSRIKQLELNEDMEEINQYYYSYEQLENLDDVKFLESSLLEDFNNLPTKEYR